MASSICRTAAFLDETDTWATINPKKIDQMGAEIADYSLPHNSFAAYGFHSADVTIVGYGIADEDFHINILELGPNGHIALDDMEKQLRESTRPYEIQVFDLDMTAIETKTVIIRGQEHILTVREGVNKSGKIYRVALVQFDGKGGPALLAMSGALDSWDQEMIEQFIREME